MSSLYAIIKLLLALPFFITAILAFIFAVCGAGAFIAGVFVLVLAIIVPVVAVATVGFISIVLAFTIFQSILH